MRRKYQTFICLIVLLLIIMITWLRYAQFFGPVHTKENGPNKLSTVRQNNTQVAMLDKLSTVRQNTTHITMLTSDAEAFNRYHVYFSSGFLNESIMDMKPIQFNSLYKNPCWFGISTNGPLDDDNLHCLPYFYLVGVKKSGTGDLYTRITRHPEVIADLKEKTWFGRTRWNYVTGYKRKTIPKILNSGVDHRSVGYYVKLFDKAAIKIQKHHSTDSTTQHRLITGDGSPSLIYAHGQWTELPGNEGLVEPRFTNYHYINHITPNSKIIVIIRDPVTRLYSDFLHTTFGYDQDSMKAEIFHDQVTQLINAYNDCFNRWSMRRCIYNETLRLDHVQRGILLADSFTCGFIAFYMKEMLEVFGEDRIHTIVNMEYDRDIKNVLNKAYNFLDLSPLSDDQLDEIAKRRRQNTRNGKKLKVGPMLDHTQDMLYNFYQPYNQHMVDLMNDSRYLFPKDAT